GTFFVSAADAGRQVRFIAENSYHLPIEIRLRFSRFENLVRPENFDDLRWVVMPRQTTELMRLDKVEGGAPAIEFKYEYIAGDPRAEHRPTSSYRVPFSSATRFPITQAYPDIITHAAPDSRHAVDIAMPVGTDIFAARGGIVFDVSSDNFEGGLDPVRNGPTANVVQILHDDGTYAVYAHLNWNSIRVRPGERVVRGQYIADSGNTGFSSGPHLHFAVLKNAGMRTESVPVEFQGADFSVVVPISGLELTAY
ncbi:MAG: M23 family metallopeptidase, partial [Gammaproteobacteria bacterium]|nr:M23 family metallopeptidase [Gammaproteobacteria bacterium]